MTQKKVTVLGCGLVGSAIAKDLSSQFQVTSVDVNLQALEKLKSTHPHIQIIQSDVNSLPSLTDLAKNTDLFVGAVPGHMGFKTVKNCIELGKNIVDISFFPEDALQLNTLAIEKGVTAIVDCGVAPGLGNIILGQLDASYQVSEYYCEVGGLPKKREWPYEYKAVFSPRDVIEEYTRPARIKINGQIVTREALSDLELSSYPNIGTLESWNSDGLRSLLQTMSHIPTMVEKTLRYPGTTQYIKVLRETGYFSEEPVAIGDKQIRPIDLTAKLLFPLWELKPGEEEFTVMKIKVKGSKDGKTSETEFILYDEFDKKTGIPSMSRTTGYTCSAATCLVLNGQFQDKGIIPPEILGKNKNHYEFVIGYLKERNITLYRTEKII